MTVKENLHTVLDTLPEARLREVLDFAEFLQWRGERQAWQGFGREQFARAYGPDEPNYTLDDLKLESNP